MSRQVPQRTVRQQASARERASRFISQAISASESAMPARLIPDAVRQAAGGHHQHRHGQQQQLRGRQRRGCLCCAWPLGRIRR